MIVSPELVRALSVRPDGRPHHNPAGLALILAYLRRETCAEPDGVVLLRYARIEGATGLPKASVYNGLRYLRDLGVVEKVTMQKIRLRWDRIEALGWPLAPC